MTRHRTKNRLRDLELELRPALPSHNRYEKWTDAELIEVIRQGNGGDWMETRAELEASLGPQAVHDLMEFMTCAT